MEISRSENQLQISNTSQHHPTSGYTNTKLGTMEAAANHIGLGTSAIGRPVYINIKTRQDEPFSLEAFKANGIAVLEHAYSKGIRYFDTAPGYGLAESLLIDWLKEKQDNSIQVATKWGYSYEANFEDNAQTHETKEHSLTRLNAQWEVSKQLLPYLKYHQIHSANFETGVLNNQAILNRLHQLKTEHHITIGLTTTGADQVKLLQSALEIKVDNEPLFEVFQCTYNILDQSIQPLAEQIISSGKRIVLKETLANGRLLSNDSYPQYKALYGQLEQLAKKYNVGTDAIALQFCIATLPGAITLSGVNKMQLLDDNLKAESFHLTDAEINSLLTFKIQPELYWEERKNLIWN
jgi:aryl-alcohol dehydrogenase-like predicted oxidoreductase